MKCPNCSYDVNRTMKHCPECGQKIEFPANTGQRIEEYRAQSLSLNMMYAYFKVSFNNQGVIIVKIDGDEEMKEAVALTLSSGTLSIEGKLPGVEINPNSASISITNDTITINGKKLDKSKKLSIELSLPWNVELDVDQYALGTMEFTTDAGGVVLHNSGYMSIEAKSFNNLEAHVSGMADLTIDDVAHGLTADISGSGDMAARSVKGDVSIVVSGSGDIEIAEIDGSLTANVGRSFFANLDDPEVKANIEVLKGQHFDLFVSFHEDHEFDSEY